MKTPRSAAPKLFVSAGGMDDSYAREMRDLSAGHDPLGRGAPPPAPTRTTACPWTETPQRKPYQPTEDISTPSLEDGVSFRQRL